MRPFASWDVHGHSGHTRATAFASLTHPKRRMEPIDDGDSRLRQTGLGKRWRPANKPMIGHVSSDHVRARLNRCCADDARRGGGSWRRRDDEQPRGAEVALWNRKIRRCIGPDGALGVVHAGCVAGLLGPIGDLGRPVLRPVQSRGGHPTRDKRHEQEPSQNGTASMHERNRKSMQLQRTN